MPSMPPLDQSLAVQMRQAIEKLTAAHEVPPRQVGRVIDDVENDVVRIRDALITRLRSDDAMQTRVQTRAMLDQVNIALSLLVGMEYPSAGVQRSLIEHARDALQRGLANHQHTHTGVST